MPLGIVSLVLHNCDVEFAADMKLLGIFAKMNGIRGVLREREILASVRMLVRHADCSSCGATQPPIKSWASLQHLELPCLRESDSQVYPV